MKLELTSEASSDTLPAVLALRTPRRGGTVTPHQVELEAAARVLLGRRLGFGWRSGAAMAEAEAFSRYVATLKALSEQREPRLEVANHGKDNLNDEQRWQREYLKSSGSVMKAPMRPPSDRSAKLPADHDEMLVHFTVRCAPHRPLTFNPKRSTLTLGGQHLTHWLPYAGSHHALWLSPHSLAAGSPHTD
jgi:hypothetical protein